MNARINTLDVREDIRSGRHPFAKIQSALNALARGEILRLLAPFEPVPLYAVAAAKGLGHKATPLPDGDWEVLFSSETEIIVEPPAKKSPAHSKSQSAGEAPAEIIDVDARGLEPPQPMIRILETLARMPQGAQLRARTDRRPVHLYSHLEERGFVGESQEQKDGSFITHIRHA